MQQSYRSMPVRGEPMSQATLERRVSPMTATTEISTVEPTVV